MSVAFNYKTEGFYFFCRIQYVSRNVEGRLKRARKHLEEVVADSGREIDGNKFHSEDGWDQNHGARGEQSANECNAKPLRIPSQIFWIHACELPSGSFPGNTIICWKRVFIQISSRCLKRCQKHRLQKYANEEIKFRKFVPGKLIQVGKKWSYKLFEILNRSFIHQIVWNFTNPLVLTFLGRLCLLISRFRTPRTQGGPKIQTGQQIRKTGWQTEKWVGWKMSETNWGWQFSCPLSAIKVALAAENDSPRLPGGLKSVLQNLFPRMQIVFRKTMPCFSTRLDINSHCHH